MAVPAAEGWTIRREAPEGRDLDLLFARHAAEMAADTPPESIHILPREALSAPGIAFYVLRDAADVPVGMGALSIGTGGTGEAEVKSMHVLAEHRGQGHSRRLLDHLLAEAGSVGVRRLSLETGAQASFAAARALYARAGFVECGPFGDYTDDPNSTYMTLAL